MSEKKKPTSQISKVSTEPTLWDLIDRHFPEPYRTIYSDPLTVCKTLQAGGRLEIKESCLGVNPAGSVSYWDRCKVHEIVSDLQQKHPEWRKEDYVNYLKNMNIKELTSFTDRTFGKWVSEIVNSKRGRPGERKNIHRP